MSVLLENDIRQNGDIFMKTAVIYWSGTGNTEAMAQAVAEGAVAELFSVSGFSGRPGLGGKKIGLFGSYGWGDGEWMRNWQERVTGDGAELVGGEGLIVNETPTDDDLANCRELGKKLAG